MDFRKKKPGAKGLNNVYQLKFLLDEKPFNASDCTIIAVSTSKVSLSLDCNMIVLSIFFHFINVRKSDRVTDNKK